jgi:hypothetical protein
MPRHASVNLYSIPQLEKILKDRRSKIVLLERKRSKIAKQLQEIDSEIHSLGGNGVAPGTRHRNKLSLIESIIEVLKKSSSPIRVADITDKVRAIGYRSISPNFRGIVNQALIKEKQFVKGAVRGTYQLKK